MPDKKEKESKPAASGTFNTSAFMTQKFARREDEVEIKDSTLLEFFPEGKKAVWKIQGLTADELARCDSAAETYEKVAAVAKGLAGDNAAKITEAIQKILGTGTDVHTEVVRRQEHLIYGSVSPKITKPMAVRIAEVAPVEFFAITNKILELTGLGQIAGKSKPSGKEQTSKTA
jgi:hypothetical protein